MRIVSRMRDMEMREPHGEPTHRCPSHITRGGMAHEEQKDPVA
jgi:hypothetical protein